MFSPVRAIVLGRGLAASSSLVAIATSSPTSARIAPRAMAWLESSLSIKGPSCSTPLSLTRRARPRAMLQALPSDLSLPSTRLMRLVSGPRSFVKTTSSIELFSSATNGTPLFGDARGQGGIWGILEDPGCASVLRKLLGPSHLFTAVSCGESQGSRRRFSQWAGDQFLGGFLEEDWPITLLPSPAYRPFRALAGSLSLPRAGRWRRPETLGLGSWS